MIIPGSGRYLVKYICLRAASQGHPVGLRRSPCPTCYKLHSVRRYRPSTTDHGVALDTVAAANIFRSVIPARNRTKAITNPLFGVTLERGGRCLGDWTSMESGAESTTVHRRR